ncbi:DNA repair exonuclease [Fodinisporobacter ferrooxydans]|uniref:DNA repair exonuclease n=1 Tax=Fodinisporobacter ferrooxydans TaxID=2901836 RepID=A0ABY4CJG7_9BACL|nr:DNA repair exonuclease [Alicyclobacillaceae bacterium MYW30-H2]
MEPFRFIHTADLHLDSPCKGMKRIGPDLQTDLQDATFHAFERIVDACMEREVDFLTIAGDLFDQPERSLRAQVHFREQAKRLQKKGIHIYIIHGNHDHLGGKYIRMEWPDNVYVFPAGKVDSQSVYRNGKELARIYGISYPAQAVSENYAKKFQRDTQAPYAIGLLHTNVGSDEQHENYAPTTVEELTAAGFDFWGLGHIHIPRILNDQNPVILYPGNPQGRHIREAGARGCYLVDVKETGVSELTFLPTDQIRWFMLQVDLTGCDRVEEMVDRLAEHVAGVAESHANTGIVRMTVHGATSLHAYLQDRENLRQVQDALQTILSNSCGNFWIESLEEQTAPNYDLELLRQQPNFIGDFLTIAETCMESPAIRDDLQRSLQEFYGRGKPLPNLSEEDFRLLLRKAGQLGLQMLLEVE